MKTIIKSSVLVLLLLLVGCQSTMPSNQVEQRDKSKRVVLVLLTIIGVATIGGMVATP